MVRPYRIAYGLGFWLLSATAAMATGPATSGGTSSSTSLGSALQTFLNTSTAPLFVAVTALCWAAGLFFFGTGFLQLAKATDSGGREGHASALVKLAAAILLLTLPDVAGIGVASITGGAQNIFGSSQQMAQISQQLDVDTGSGTGTIATEQSTIASALGNASVATPQDCLTGGVTCIAQNIATNAVPMGIYTIFTLSMLAGLTMFGSCIFALVKGYGSGGGGQGLPPGFWAKMFTSLILINSPWLISMFTTSLVGQSGVLTLTGFNASSSLLSYTYSGTGTGTGSQALAQFQTLIGYVLTILAFFGVWAFFRGVFMVKATAEGKQSGTYGHGLVFMVGGILLANAKMSTCMIMYTFGGTSMTFGFCS